MKIINFKSEKRNNFFAPEWNAYIGEDNISNYPSKLNITNLTNYLLSIESDILSLPITNKNNISDGYTGLGNNSTTSRYGEYNIFDNTKFKHTELEHLKTFFRLSLQNFLDNIGIEIPKTLYVQSWYNVLRKNEKIKEHLHGTGPDSYLGCHVCLKTYNTSTFYINSINQINHPLTHESKNTIGDITFFSGHLPHFTNTHKGDDERVTIAMDLSLVPCQNFVKIW